MTTPIDWQAAMISPLDDHDGSPLLRHEFDLDAGHGDVTAARLHVTALGVVTAYLGGAPVGDAVLSPGWSSYEWRVRYRTHDVADRLTDHSVLGLALGNGWYRGRLGWAGRHALYGDRLGAIAQLEIDFTDGHRQIVVTDSTWSAGPSAVLANDLYDGETIDARRVDDGWLEPGEPDGWSGVEVLDFDRARLVPYVGPPIRRQETLHPTAIVTSPSGRTIVDFGQNLVGWVRVRVRGPRGHEVTLRHAEVLEHGELGTRPLRTAKATDRFVLSGGDDTFEPTLTFHGFRYVEVDGWPGELDPHALEAVVVHSDLRRTGTFECSDPLVNQLHRNVVWGMRGNFLDVPTDCPQRDERLGWTGDLSVFAPAAAFLFDVDAFLRDWLLDVAAEQRAAGAVPYTVPDILKYGGSGMPRADTAVWGDAAVWVPWTLWQAYGDPAVLEQQYDSMTAHVDRITGLLSPNGLWDTGFQFADWLDPDAAPDRPWEAKADRYVVATLAFFRTVRMVADAARALDHAADAARFDALAARTRDAFAREYVGDDGRVASDAPTVYALAVAFDLLDDGLRQAAGDRLAELVAANDHRISTGFAGTPFVCDALTQTGHLDDAYRLLLQTERPSWLYSVTMGATTIWERWDSMLPDGTVNPGEMTSFNHYAFGAIADWLHRTVGGIAPLAPGYTRVLVAPRPGGGIDHASTRLDSRHGPIAVEWHLDGGEIVVEVTLPDDVTGVLDLPGVPPVDLTPGASTHRAPRH